MVWKCSSWLWKGEIRLQWTKMILVLLRRCFREMQEVLFTLLNIYWMTKQRSMKSKKQHFGQAFLCIQPQLEFEINYLLLFIGLFWLIFNGRMFWMLAFTFALIGAACHLQTIWQTYDVNLTRTTIISTYFKYANIPFPSVTVCDSSRIDWYRAKNL